VDSGKKQEGIWAEVIAYDADDLEQWFRASTNCSYMAAAHSAGVVDAQDLGSFGKNGRRQQYLFWFRITPC